MGEYVSPLQEAIRTAESRITEMVDDKDTAEWSMDDTRPRSEGNEWVVGRNKGQAGDAEVVVEQTLGPDAANGQVFYRAETPAGNIFWRAGANNLSDLRYGPENHASRYASSGLALKALHSVGAARLREAAHSEQANR